MKLMDGSMADMHIASNPDGTGMKIQMENVTLQSLGLDGYNVTGNFDINDVIGAMEKISTSRSGTGAITNAMEHAYNYNVVAGAGFFQKPYRGSGHSQGGFRAEEK